MPKKMTSFDVKFIQETNNLKTYSFKPDQAKDLEVGQYIKFMHGISSNHLTRMVGKIINIGISPKHNCKYFETITSCGYYTTTTDNIYQVYKARIKEKIKANHSASCIALKTQHSEELPYMISTLDKMKNYITRKKIGVVKKANIVDTNRSYCYDLTVKYPKCTVVYSIPNRNAHNIEFGLTNTSKKKHTFKVRNRKGAIDLNFEKVKRMIKRYLTK